MSQSAITVNQVTVTYRNGHTALRDATFQVPGGSIAALVGVNGSGKSTLFKALMGFVRLADGEISILRLPVNNALKQNLIAYVPQSEEVDWSFPVLVEDVVMMGRYGHMGWLRRPKAADRASVDAALARVDMLEYRHRQIGELSGGQKKREPCFRAILQPRSNPRHFVSAIQSKRCDSTAIPAIFNFRTIMQRLINIFNVECYCCRQDGIRPA